MAETGTSTTVEIPLTPAVRSFVLGRARFSRWGGYVSAAFFAALGLFLLFLVLAGTSGGVLTVVLAAITVLATGLLTFFMGAYGEVTWRRAQRDVRDGVYLQTTGPVRVNEVELQNTQGLPAQRYELVIGGRTLAIDMYLAFALEDQSFATVAYSKYSGIVFEARDLSGNPLYRHKKL